jgi:hypothetical protein
LDGTAQEGEEFAWRHVEQRKRLHEAEDERRRVRAGEGKATREQDHMLGATHVRLREVGRRKAEGRVQQGDRGCGSGRAAVESAARVRAEEKAER